MQLLYVEDRRDVLDGHVYSIESDCPSWNITTSDSISQSLLRFERAHYDVILISISSPQTNLVTIRKELTHRKINAALVVLTQPFLGMDELGVRLGLSRILPRGVTSRVLIEALEDAYYQSKVFIFKEEYLSPIASLSFEFNNRKYTKSLCSDYTVGRDKECDVRINHPKVSRAHFRLTREYLTGEYLLTDTSSNGVQINGVKVNSYQKLKHGDLITIPGCDLHLHYLGAKEEDRNKTLTGEDEQRPDN